MKKVLIVRTELFVVAIYFPDGSRDIKSKAVMCVIDHWSTEIKASLVGVPNDCPKQQRTCVWESIFEIEKNKFVHVKCTVDFASKKSFLSFSRTKPYTVRKGVIIDRPRSNNNVCDIFPDQKAWICKIDKSRKGKGIRSFRFNIARFRFLDLFDESRDQFFFIEDPWCVDGGVDARFVLYEILG